GMKFGRPSLCDQGRDRSNLIQPHLDIPSLDRDPLGQRRSQANARPHRLPSEVKSWNARSFHRSRPVKLANNEIGPIDLRSRSELTGLKADRRFRVLKHHGTTEHADAERIAPSFQVLTVGTATAAVRVADSCLNALL